MGFWVYPENYEPPAPPEPIVLTPTQRDWVKTRLQTYITNQARPIYSVELVSEAQQRLLSNFGVLVSEAQLEAVCAEILAEWGAPEFPEEPE